MADWEDQLSVLFPEVRMKGVIEIRGSDAAPTPMVQGLAAFWKGLLYSKESRDWAWDLVRRLSIEERRNLRDAAGRVGLRARTPDGRTLAALATDPLEAASLGLCRQGACGEKGEDERVWLGPLMKMAGEVRSPADEALEAFRSGGAAALSAHLRIAG